jgi:hypothetical protein
VHYPHVRTLRTLRLLLVPSKLSLMLLLLSNCLLPQGLSSTLLTSPTP